MPSADITTRSERQARDVIAFGQEGGRVLFDGRIVGRAEPGSDRGTPVATLSMKEAEALGETLR